MYMQIIDIKSTPSFAHSGLVTRTKRKNKKTIGNGGFFLFPQGFHKILLTFGGVAFIIYVVEIDRNLELYGAGCVLCMSFERRGYPTSKV